MRAKDIVDIEHRCSANNGKELDVKEEGREKRNQAGGAGEET